MIANAVGGRLRDDAGDGSVIHLGSGAAATSGRNRRHSQIGDAPLAIALLAEIAVQPH